MDKPFCSECKAIYEELLKLVEISRRTKPGPNATAQQLANWFDEREAREDHQQRWRPALSNLRLRLAEHQKVTGHAISFPLPPGGMNSQN